VLVVILDDMKVNPRDEYLRTLEFLEVPDDGRETFPVQNPGKRHRSAFLARLIKHLSQQAREVKRSLRIQRNFGILNRIQKVNTVAGSRDPLSREMRVQLVEYFRDDVMTLSELLHRDLSGWLELTGQGFGEGAQKKYGR